MPAISDAIIEAKKFNVALRAVTYNKNSKKNEWRNLAQVEDEFRVELSEEDKRRLLKKKDELIRELQGKKLHNILIAEISKIFQFEEKKGIMVPTKDAAQYLNESAELMGLLLKAYGISTSQIRRYLDGLRKIKATSSLETFTPSYVLLLQVKVAYAAGRDSNLTFLYEVMKPAIMEGSKGYHCFEHLLRFVEAIVAYHRFYRGEE